ncbi:TPA: acyltransferase [Klebsiella pneumoniae]|uniref:acyltransferase n=2 Tax=Klebsiella/Raoultella group TaxID=2890311 RepID=UPI001F3CE801|nr:acyltransferase [Klebsiella pneumoniae]
MLPVWSFFTLFFIFIYIFRPSGFSELLSLKMIASTFMLNGFGYVWIIRVFLIIAILSPLYVFFTSRMNGYSVSILAFLMVLLSTIASMVDYYSQGKLIGHFIYDVIFPAVSYGAVFIVGYKFITFSKIEKTFLFLLFLMTIGAYLAHNYITLHEVKGFQEYKYPPTMYYISFSFVMIIIVNYIFDFFLKDKKLPRLILNISANTIWIYLWHIPVVEFFHRNYPDVNFSLKYVLAVVLSISITLVQVSLVRKLVPNSKTMNAIFTG